MPLALATNRLQVIPMSYNFCLNNRMPSCLKKKRPGIITGSLKTHMVLHGGFEPSTLGLEVPCSIQLS